MRQWWHFILDILILSITLLFIISEIGFLWLNAEFPFPSVFRKFVDYFIMKMLYIFIDITFFEFLRGGGSCAYLLPLGDALGNIALPDLLCNQSSI